MDFIIPWRLLRTKKHLLRDGDTERMVVETENYLPGIRRNFLHFEPRCLPPSKLRHKRQKMSGKN